MSIVSEMKPENQSNGSVDNSAMSITERARPSSSLGDSKDKKVYNPMSNLSKVETNVNNVNMTAVCYSRCH